MTPLRSVHKYPYDLLATQIVEASEADLRVVYKNLRGKSETAYLYSDVSPRTSLTRGGENGWKRPAMQVFFLAFFTFLFGRSRAWYLASGALGFAALVLYSASFRRFNWQSFYLNNGEYLFSLLLPEDSELAEYIIKRVEKGTIKSTGAT